MIAHSVLGMDTKLSAIYAFDGAMVTLLGGALVAFTLGPRSVECTFEKEFAASREPELRWIKIKPKDGDEEEELRAQGAVRDNDPDNDGIVYKILEVRSEDGESWVRPFDDSNPEGGDWLAG